MKGRMKKIASLVLAFVLCAGSVLNVGAVTIDEAEKKADKLESEKKAAEAEKKALAEKLNKIIKQMNQTEEELTQKEAEIEEAENELVQAKTEEDNQYQSMKKRIKFMYEGGNKQFLEVLMSSENIGDLLNKAEYVSKLSPYDRDMLEEFQATVKSVEEKEAKLQDEYEKLDKLQDQLVEQQNEVQDMVDNKAAEIEEIKDQISANAAVLKELKEKAEQARKLKEEQEKARKAAAAAAAAKKNSSSSSSGSSSGSSSSSSGSSGSSSSGGSTVVSGSGYFTHPCPGMSYQSSYFGEVRSFDPTPHKGNDYAAAEGTPTYAAAAGTVIIAGWSNSAGNWVVISHGNGLVSKYMHHSSITVSAGQYVEKGQQIGYVGSTGYSTGAHLHFQVELNGVAVSPDSYM